MLNPGKGSYDGLGTGDRRFPSTVSNGSGVCARVGDGGGFFLSAAALLDPRLRNSSTLCCDV